MALKVLKGNQDGFPEMTRGAIPFVDSTHVKTRYGGVAAQELCSVVNSYRFDTWIFS
jgi:hypothetical protein